jgi:hypothetical protein
VRVASGEFVNSIFCRGGFDKSAWTPADVYERVKALLGSEAVKNHKDIQLIRMIDIRVSSTRSFDQVLRIFGGTVQ